ncbi:hypothetical protein PQX77_002899 [Marasmius sp. AFHP31]|nr:hypothetical protein PQX77_002899 [Marasmius sp. AFHP31]
MPAHKIHTTKKQQQEALRRKYRKYYVLNREAILARKRMRHLDRIIADRRARKAERLKEQLRKWYDLLEREYERDTLEELFELESHVNIELDIFGSAYMARLYSEYLGWNDLGLDLDNSPLEVPLILFNIALEIAAKISAAVLNEFGSSPEWNTSKRLIRRIKLILSCLQEMEVVVTMTSAGAGIEGFREQRSKTERLQGKGHSKGREELAGRHAQGLLLFQQEFEKGWLDRYSCKTSEPRLDTRAQE